MILWATLKQHVQPVTGSIHTVFLPLLGLITAEEILVYLNCQMDWGFMQC